MERLALLAVLACGPAAGSVLAQTVTFGVEPNGTKQEATAAPGMMDGDIISNAFDSTGLNFFEVATAPAPHGIYRHSLELGNPCWVTLYGGASVVDHVIPDSTHALQPVQVLDFASTSGGSTWYGFGRAEEVYVDLRSHNNFRGAGAAVLRTTSVTPADIGGLPLSTLPGTRVDLFAEVLGSPQADTELHLFDEHLRPIPGHAVDDPDGPGSSANRTYHLPSGRYYAACTAGGISSAVPASSLFADFALFNTVTDDPGAVAASTRAPAGEVRFTANSSNPFASISGTNVETQPFELSWFTFIVGPPSGLDEVVFCAGDGPSIPCPCGTPAPTTVEGCPNSTGRGAEAITWRHQPFAPRARLTLRGLPPSMATLPFVSTGRSADLPAGGGRFCLDPGATRLDVLTADGHGTAESELDLSGVPGAMVGQVLYIQAGYRDVMAPSGCTLNFTSGTGVRLL